MALLASGPMSPRAKAAFWRTSGSSSLSNSVRAATAPFASGPICPNAAARATPRPRVFVLEQLYEDRRDSGPRRGTGVPQRPNRNPQLPVLVLEQFHESGNGIGTILPKSPACFAIPNALILAIPNTFVFGSTTYANKDQNQEQNARPHKSSSDA